LQKPEFANKTVHFIFCDNAKNFHSQRLFATLFSDESILAKYGCFQLFFFVAGHGKTKVDGGFGLIGNDLKNLKTQDKVHGFDACIVLFFKVFL
jgi:hypothetical protein